MTVFVAGIAPVFSVLVVIVWIFKLGKTFTPELWAVAVVLGVDWPSNFALVPLVKPVKFCPPDLPVYCITSLWITGT